ncbi:MAG TPA: hypothetical protein VG269_21465 [Tepidisphaeraceae bacterium]|jgi:hypothetical protein|nr:hypothetical protein [Tepidisphaeraceae bacterium]
MALADDTITLTFPRAVIGDVISLSESLLERMHSLLERNSEGGLSPLEREELEALVEIAQFGQLLSIALAAPEI